MPHLMAGQMLFVEQIITPNYGTYFGLYAVTRSVILLDDYNSVNSPFIIYLVVVAVMQNSGLFHANLGESQNVFSPQNQT